MDSTDQARPRRWLRRHPGAPDGPDREPRDWRWALGVLGRTLITLGLLILAFVVYQLWGTGIEFRANQNDLAKEFRIAAASATSVPGIGADVTSDTVESTDISAAPSTTTLPNGNPSTTASPPAGTDTSSSDSNSSGSTGSTATSKPKWGVVAAMKMPAISDSTLYVVNGVSQGDLKRGIGHYPGTAKPGEYGNLALAGHRTTYGAPFEDLDQLQPGDRVIIDSIDGGHYEYVVESQEIIGPDEVRVLSRPRNPRDAVLTLTTCHPKHSTARRLVVHARLDAAASTPLAGSGGTAPGETTPPGDPATSVASTTLPPPRSTSTTTSTSSTASSTSPVTTGAPSTAQPATTTAPATTAPPSTISPSTSAALPDQSGDGVSAGAARVLGTGWFHDRAAWPQIILWALPLVALAVLGRQLGKRWRRWWLGGLAVAAPFLVVLYFFFQNVNRLLPPGL